MLAAIIVTHAPSLAVLQRLLELISGQVQAVIVVDNGSPQTVTNWLRANLQQLILLPDNQGLATAQNQGIEQARSLGASHVLLLDQDSEPATLMVAELLAAWRQLQAPPPAKGQPPAQPIALIAPQVIDRRRQQPLPYFRAGRRRLEPVHCGEGSQILPIHTAIASGSLIPLSAIDAVGPLRDELFIDLVDIDWCWRAHHQGLRAFGACRARLQHHLGDQPRRILGRDITIHSPERTYYFIRNALWLSRSQPFPWAWKLAILFQIGRRALFLILFAAPRLNYARWTLRACRDALRGRLGPA